MRLIKLWWILTGIILLVNVLGYLTFKEQALLILSDTLPVVCSLLSVIGVAFALVRFKTFDFTKTAWLLILIGLIFDFLAESTYGMLEIFMGMDMNEVCPSIADYLWCFAYIPFFIGLIMMITGYKNSGFPILHMKKYIIIGIVSTVLIILVIYFLLIPIIVDDETSTFAKVTYMFYPIADTLVVTISVLIMAIILQFGRSLVALPWKLMAFGFILFTVCDLLYSYLSWQNLYNDGNIIDIGWNLGYLLIGFSGLYQKQLIDTIDEGGL
jgi:hypothetical protein